MGDIALGSCRILAWPGSAERLVTLPGNWHEHVKVGPRDRVELQAGNRRVTAQAVFSDDEEVQMTDSLREALCLPLGPIRVKTVNGVLHFGPFVGLYALPVKGEGKLFGELTRVFEDMMRVAEEEGVALFVFVPGEARWERQDGMTTAYVYRKDPGHWVRTKRPLPDLVLTKVLVPPPEAREQVRRDMVQIALHVPFGLFSRPTGDKWDVHRTLAASSETRHLLPDTALVSAPSDVERMLARHGAVYVKPVMGTQGRAIYRLDRRGPGVVVRYSRQGRAVRRGLKAGGAAWRGFVQRAFCAKRRFLVQQALDLVTVQSVRPVDFRWLVQKDGANAWQITARVARVGTTGAITTNLHTGGGAVLAERWLRSNGWKEEGARAELLARLDEGALAIARVLEAKAGRIGELGIDLALTKQREIYLIEINPRPGRQMLRETQPALRELSLRRNLEYANCVTGF